MKFDSLWKSEEEAKNIYIQADIVRNSSVK